MSAQERPAWAPSRETRSNKPRSVRTGVPHSRSWYSSMAALEAAQLQVPGAGDGGPGWSGVSTAWGTRALRGLAAASRCSGGPHGVFELVAAHLGPARH